MNTNGGLKHHITELRATYYGSNVTQRYRNSPCTGLWACLEGGGAPVRTLSDIEYAINVFGEFRSVLGTFVICVRPDLITAGLPNLLPQRLL